MKYDYEEQIKQITGAVKKFDTECITKETKRITKALEKFDFTPIVQQYTDIGKQLQKFCLENPLENLIENIQKSLEPFKKIIEQLPNFQDYENLQEWGNYGWGFVDFFDLEKTYFKKVTTTQEADSIMESYLTDDIVNELIENINNEIEMKEEFQESIECEHEGKYTACILILYSLIDSIYIKTQRFPKKIRRPLAGGQASYLQRNEDLDQLPYRYYFKVAIGLDATIALFKDGKDFQIQTDLPNRNFISHGMSTRPVTKLDCLKVLTVLKNIIDIKDFLTEE